MVLHIHISRPRKTRSRDAEIISSTARQLIEQQIRDLQREHSTALRKGLVGNAEGLEQQITRLFDKLKRGTFDARDRAAVWDALSSAEQQRLDQLLRRYKSFGSYLSMSELEELRKLQDKSEGKARDRAAVRMARDGITGKSWAGFDGYIVQSYSTGWKLIEGSGKNRGQWLAMGSDPQIFSSQKQAEEHIELSTNDKARDRVRKARDCSCGGTGDRRARDAMPIGKRVKIKSGMREFIGQTGTIVDNTEKDGSRTMYRVRLDRAVEIPGVGRVDNDLWEGSTLGSA